MSHCFKIWTVSLLAASSLHWAKLTFSILLLECVWPERALQIFFKTFWKWKRLLRFGSQSWVGQQAFGSGRGHKSVQTAGTELIRVSSSRFYKLERDSGMSLSLPACAMVLSRPGRTFPIPGTSQLQPHPSLPWLWSHMWPILGKKASLDVELIFQTVVLEKTLASPLDCKEIKPVNPKGKNPEIHWKDLILKLKL